jgi:hypothetical protein
VKACDVPGVGKLRQVAADRLYGYAEALREILVGHEAALTNQRNDLAVPLARIHIG